MAYPATPINMPMTEDISLYDDGKPRRCVIEWRWAGSGRTGEKIQNVDWP